MSAAMGDVAQHIRVDVDALVRCGDLPPQLVSASSVFVMRRFGEAIRAAIKRFQQKRGMRADGRLDSVTQNSLLTVADTLETL
jgi:murein L,D-transpeptidase YcbB/YkuD